MQKRDFGGVNTKKHISTALALLIAAVVICTVFSGCVETAQTAATPDEAVAAIETPGVLQTLTGNRDFSAHMYEDNEAATEETEEAISETDAEPQPTAQSDQPVYTADTIPAVTGAKRIGDSADSLTLGWDRIPGVSGYRVYWRDLNQENSGSHLFSTVSSPEISIRNLKRGAKYEFKIAAFCGSGMSAFMGEAVEVQFATIPDVVEGFTMTAATKNATEIAWEKNDRSDGYVLERCFNGEWSEYQTFDRETTSFTDEGLEGGRAYFYRIRAIREDSTGVLSGESDTVYTVAGLLGPKDKDSASKLGRVSLDYEKSAYADGYEIYYAKSGENFEKLGDTESTHYSTSRLEDGETYLFRIYPYRNVSGMAITGTPTELEFTANKVIYDKEVGDTYVEVSLADQHMWYIVDGDVYLESDCVTGNYRSADTPKGFWKVNNKISPCTLKGDDYVSHVTYWMPFIGGGWGLHDATWRSRFGGSIYKGDGSHGCVNLPYDIAKKMYAHIEIGTPVIVY